MAPVRTPLLLALLALALAPALATHTPMGKCAAEDLPALGIVEVSGGTADSSFYLDDRGQLEWGIWVYLETNGVWTGHGAPGVFVDDDITRHDIQRGGTTPFFTARPPTLDPAMNEPDLCVDDHRLSADTLVL